MEYLSLTFGGDLPAILPIRIVPPIWGAVLTWRKWQSPSAATTPGSACEETGPVIAAVVARFEEVTLTIAIAARGGGGGAASGTRGGERNALMLGGESSEAKIEES